MNQCVTVAMYGRNGHGWSSTDTVGAKFIAYCPATPEESQVEVLQAFADKGQHPQWFTDYQEMLVSVKPQVVVIDAAFAEHYAAAAFALQQGCAVFCEKPIAFTLEECDKLQKLATKQNLPLWAMQTWRYESSLYTAKQLLQQGVVGEIRLVNGQKSYKMGTRPDYYYQRESYGGTIPWVAIHAIDAVLYLTDLSVVEVFARHSSIANGNHGTMESTATCMLTLEQDVFATISADFYRPNTAWSHGDDRIRVVGTEGVLEILHEQVYLLNHSHDGKTPMPLSSPPAMFADFLQVVLKNSPAQLTTAQSIESTRIALRCRDCADSHQ